MSDGAGPELEEWCQGWGRWQARLALLLALPVMLTGAYGTNYVFLAAPMTFRCEVPECEGNISSVALPGAATPNWTAWALGDEQCSRWKPLDGSCGPDSFNKSASIPCDRFVYGPGGSIVAEFGLACQEWKRSLVGTVHNVGMLVSLPIMGYVSDRWGRRAALIASACGAGVLGLAKSFAASYYVYLAGELLETVFGASVYPAAFVLMIEWLGVQHRIQTSLVLGIPLALGSAALSLLDYLTGYWRLWAWLAYPPSFLLLLYPWVLPESVRWLSSRGRVPEAIRAMKQAAACNRVAISEDTLNKMLMEQKKQAEGVVLEEESLLRALVQYGSVRRRLAVCFAWWFSAVFVFYGLAVNAHALAGSLHANFALLAAGQLPALLLNTLLLDRVGRRPLLTAALLLTSISLIASSYMTTSASRWAGTAFYLVGVMGSTMTLNALYVYTAELFPTRARQRLLAASSTVGRLGAILAPLTPLLATFRPWIPTLLFGALPLLSAVLTRLMPDTLHCPLPNSFADLEPPSTTPSPSPSPSRASVS